MNDNLRGTGRTTRMLEYAISQAIEGKIVFVYCGTDRQMGDLREQAIRMAEAARLHVDSRWKALMIGSGSISFGRVTARFDWRVMREPGIPEEAVTLVDHYTIETELRSVSEMLHRFDPGALPDK